MGIPSAMNGQDPQFARQLGSALFIAGGIPPWDADDPGKHVYVVVRPSRPAVDELPWSQSTLSVSSSMPRRADRQGLQASCRRASVVAATLYTSAR